MRWVTCRAPGRPDVDRVGLVVDDTVRVPHGVTSLLSLLGDDGTKLRDAAERARRTPSAVFALHDVRLLPPIPEPRSIRDFSSFEAHYRAGLKAIGREFDPTWYEAPVFYFSHPSVCVGDAVDVPFPSETREMDFELEVAAIVGRTGTDLSPDEAEACIAGYTIFNDWSARDLLRTDLRRSLLGPSKGKDFANGLGPFLVTRDELEPRRKGKGYDLAMTAHVNRREVSRGRWSDLYWSFAEMVAHASRDSRVVPGDVIASGTVGTGCVMELAATQGVDRYPWLEDGDEVVVAIEGLGELRNRVRRGREPGR
jgi:2-keto-4-pentenoate hydratase/2-oxohepta-3-ene-1,7-dioic acid hydratase in catechol pathway